MIMSETKSYLKNLFFIIFFSWISFFPQPVQEQYGIYTRVFLAGFLFVLLLDKKSFRSLFEIQNWPLWVFLICLGAGVISAADKRLAISTCMYLVITFFLLFYIAKAIFNSRGSRDIVSLTICICSMIVAIIGLLELYFGKNILHEGFIYNPYYERYISLCPRPMSTQFNPAILGSYLLGCLPFNFYILRNKKRYLYLVGLSSSILGIVVIILAFSRGVFLALIAMLLFYLWKCKGKLAALSLLAILMIFILICSFHNNANLNRFGFARFVAGSHDSIFSEYRLDRVKMAYRILKEYPIFGIGFRHFRRNFDKYYDGRWKGQISYEFKIPDNMYLTFLAETGIIGASGFLIFIIFLFRRAFKRLKELKGEQGYHDLLIPLSALVGLLVNMGGYELFYWNTPYMLFCLICGFIFANGFYSNDNN